MEPGLVHMPDPGTSARGEHAAFSMLEKLVLLQGVKIFRYVTVEYLPSIASCCEPTFCMAGAHVFEEEQPTNATLYIVAEGSLGLYTRSGSSGTANDRQAAASSSQLQRRLLAGDSVGN